MAHDDLNRLTGKYQTNTSGTKLALYEYDTLNLGQLAATKAYNGTSAVQVTVRAVTQDARYRPTQQKWIVAGSDGGTFRFDYTYNKANQKSSITYPLGAIY